MKNLQNTIELVLFILLMFDLALIAAVHKNRKARLSL